DLGPNNINHLNTLIVKDGFKYYFVNIYNKKNILNKKIIENIKNKNDFLYNIYDDNKILTSSNNEILTQIKNTTLEIIKDSKNDDEKIKSIYDWIVNNIDYYENFSDGNKNIYSGIETFKNRVGVCDGYTKIFSYMLSFAGIQDVEVKRGFAFDSQDFPNYGHAWVRIGNYYYDPTFDDPLGFKYSNYSYFKVPYDLIYVNRFDGFDIPENLKELSLENRKKIVISRYLELYPKYSEYYLMKRYKDLYELGFSYDEEITIENFLEKIDYIEVKDNTFLENNQLKQIKSLRYYELTLNNIINIINNPDLSIKDLKLLKWYNSNGNFDYKLAYELTLN
ncbi:MAG: hypothetical protein NWP80_01165, partial [Candidatus Gracilibacteria bacterium]|nr:hypothetical protein [Candidatus Gracilibacteria bacterium]